MSTILPFVIAAGQLLVPQRDHAAIDLAIAARVGAEAPLFADDTDRKRTAALIVSIAFNEGSLGLHVEGDRVRGVPTSWCTMQINLSPGAKTFEGWTGPELRDDPDKCIAVGMRLLRDSMRWCPSAPLAIYASGPKGCSNARAQRISRHRIAMSIKLIRDVAASGRTTSLFLPSNAILPHEHLAREAKSHEVFGRTSALALGGAT